MPFAEDFAAAGLAQLIETLGETVVYKPADGPERQITAIVDRSPPAYAAGNGEVVRPMMAIELLDDAEAGISAAELDTGGDAIAVAHRRGGQAEDHLIAIPDDGRPWNGYGGLRLELH